MLNDFFDASTRLVNESGGVMISFIGDAMIAAFNAPVAVFVIRMPAQPA